MANVWASGPAEIPSDTNWLRRPTIRQLKKQIGTRTLEINRDEKENEWYRLPGKEHVQLAAMSLYEAYTPASIENLYAKIATLPIPTAVDREILLENAKKLRRSELKTDRIVDLGVAARPGSVVHHGFSDPQLPPYCELVSFTLFAPTQSLTILVASFVFSESNELSQILREDRSSKISEILVLPSGRLKNLRSKIGYSRPKKASERYRIDPPGIVKRIQVSELLERRHRECAYWLANRFGEGRLAREDYSRRRPVPVFLTNKASPFENRIRALEPVGLDYETLPWVADGRHGWRIRAYSATILDEYPVLAAARRGDLVSSAGRSRNGQVDSRYGGSTFHTENGHIVARLALDQLLSAYFHGVDRFKDSVGAKGQRARGAAGTAATLDNYLINDGMDVAVLMAEMKDYDPESITLHWRSLDYTFILDKDWPPTQYQKLTKMRFLEELDKVIAGKARQLTPAVTAARETIMTSATLKQVVQSIRLQYISAVISIVALIVAVISIAQK